MIKHLITPNNYVHPYLWYAKGYQMFNVTMHGFLGVENFADKAWLMYIGFSRAIIHACDLYL